MTPAYCPERAAAHARKTVADEGRVEHDPRLVEAVARAIEAADPDSCGWDSYCYLPMATAALNAIAKFEREEG